MTKHDNLLLRAPRLVPAINCAQRVRLSRIREQTHRHTPKRKEPKTVKAIPRKTFRSESELALLLNVSPAQIRRARYLDQAGRLDQIEREHLPPVGSFPLDPEPEGRKELVMIAQPLQSMSDLDLMIANGYGDTPQSELPPDWRTRVV